MEYSLIHRYTLKFGLFLFIQIGTNFSSNQRTMYHKDCQKECPTECTQGWYYWHQGEQNNVGWMNADDGWILDDDVAVICGKILGNASKLSNEI